MMRLNLCLLITLCALAMPAQGFLAQKLELLKDLTGGLVGGSGRSAGGYGSGYSYSAPSRPLYTGYENYGRQANYNSGNEEVVKVIKIVVPAQGPSYVAPQQVSSYSSGSSYGSSWVPAPQPLPVQQTVSQDSVQVVASPQPVQVQQPVYQVRQQVPVQVQQPVYQVRQQVPVPVQVQQPVYQVRQQVAQPVPVQVNAPQPVQVVQPAPQPIYRNTIYQEPTVLKTVKLIVAEEDTGRNGGYGYGPSVNDYSRSYNQGPVNWNQSWKSGGVYEKVGC